MNLPPNPGTDPKSGLAHGTPSSPRHGLGYGMGLGLIGMLMFALTLPFTKLAITGLDPWFLSFGRATVAALFGAALLLVTRPARPRREHAWPLFWVAFGNVVGFPLLIGLALRDVPSSHAAVVTGLLPLATACFAALSGRERPSPAFWLTAVAGSSLVVAFALREGAGTLQPADGLLFLAMVCGSIGYVAGARVTPQLGGLETISWALLLALPLTLPATLWLGLHDGGAQLAAAGPRAWAGFAYVSVFSMFVGFLFWFRGMALGGMARVGQLQLLQPFVTLLGSALLLSEPLNATTFAFAAAVVLTVVIGRRTGVRRVP